MSLTQERINELALDCAKEQLGFQPAHGTLLVAMRNKFLSRLRDEQKAVSHDDPRADEIVSGLYRKFKEWSNRKFYADDVTWCEVKGEINKLISIKFTIPPAASDCKELVEALEKIAGDGNGHAQYRMWDTARQALANHAKRMNGEE